MNYSTYRFTLDIHKTKSQVSIPVLYGDTGIQFFITLTDGGKPYFIEDGCRAVFSAKKPDGTVLFNDCIIEANTRILYQFTTQTTNVEGMMNCELRLYGTDGNLITTPCFVVVVDPRVVYDYDLDGSIPEATAIDNMMKAETARAIAEAIRVEAEENRVAAEEARAEAEAERQAAHSALTKSVKEGKGEFSIVQAAPEGSENSATGKGAGAFGAHSKADADYAFALGSWAAARKQGAFAANAGDAKEIFSAAFGDSYANADRSFAKGFETNANAYASETGGIETIVEEAAIAGVADGKGSIAGAPYSAAHNLGCKTGADAKAAYAGGDKSEANHEGAFVHGLDLRTGRNYQAVVGMLNAVDPDALFVVGGGSNDVARRNLFKVTESGAELMGTLGVGTVRATSVYAGGFSTDGIYISDGNNPNLYKNTVYCANQAGEGVVFANKLTARKWNWQGGGWLDATLTYDDIIALKSGGGGGSGTVDAYSKSEIDAMLGSYINGIDTLVGGV